MFIHTYIYVLQRVNFKLRCHKISNKKTFFFTNFFLLFFLHVITCGKEREKYIFVVKRLLLGLESCPTQISVCLGRQDGNQHWGKGKIDIYSQNTCLI